MFSKILVANRGEVAVRIIRACKEMGIETVAVYSEADRNSLPVALADERICIGGNAAAESYLNQKNIISAALATNAEAIHPGYGFLSENAGFAKLCEENGIVFIGPKSEVISAMGDKDTSRQLMQQVGVPVVPGTEVLKDVEEAKKYANLDGSELNMVFQFEHMDVDSDEKAGKWTTRKMDLRNLKKILTRWQKGLQDIAWNSLYWENHDQPRSVSRFGNDSDEYREISAKMLATCIHMMQGTPYVYQGEELGMTNCPFNTLDNFRDLESINAFHELTEQGKMTEEDMMAAIGYKGRDNARTPMQWDDSAYAGFSTTNPWIMVNPNYTKINAKDQVNREDSVFKYYQKLIKLRHESELIVYGTYDLILDDDKDIYAYIRTLGDEKLIVYCNFSENTREVELPEEFVNKKVLISNYSDAKANPKITLRPYEAIVIQK